MVVVHSDDSARGLSVSLLPSTAAELRLEISFTALRPHMFCMRGVHSYRINFRTFLYIVDSLPNLVPMENLCSNLTCTFSMSVACSCTIFVLY